MAARFLVGAEASLERLADMPEVGRPFNSDKPELAGVRVFPIRRFPRHLVFYRPLKKEKGVEVIRVLHSARDLPRVLRCR